MLNSLIWLIIIIVVISIISAIAKRCSNFTRSNNKIAQKDKEKKYKPNDVLGAKSIGEKGEQLLLVKYNAYEDNKKNYIIGFYSPGREIEFQNGDKFMISNVIYEEYYNESMEGPFVMFSINPIALSTETSVSIDTRAGTLELAYGILEASQSIQDSNSEDRLLIQYREHMIIKGIKAKDIDEVIDNPEDRELKKSFFEKYEQILNQMYGEIMKRSRDLF